MTFQGPRGCPGEGVEVCEAPRGAALDQVEPLSVDQVGRLEPRPARQLPLLAPPRLGQVDASVHLGALIADLDRFWGAGEPCPACLGSGRKPDRRVERVRTCRVCGVSFLQVYGREHGRTIGGRGRLYCSTRCVRASRRLGLQGSES
jgi:hypothetical protein